MLTITIPGDEFWDDEAEKFCYSEDVVLQFEHSLVSLSKWEAKHHKLFLTNEKPTEEEMLSYLEMMLLSPVEDVSVLRRLTAENAKQLDEYINDPMTATTFSSAPEGPKTSERISSELIYYWMHQYQIPHEAQNWHLNRLFTLIRVHHAKSQKPKPMSKEARARTMAEINAQRKARLGTTG